MAPGGQVFILEPFSRTESAYEGVQSKSPYCTYRELTMKTFRKSLKIRQGFSEPTRDLSAPSVGQEVNREGVTFVL